MFATDSDTLQIIGMAKRHNFEHSETSGLVRGHDDGKRGRRLTAQGESDVLSSLRGIQNGYI